MRVLHSIILSCELYYFYYACMNIVQALSSLESDDPVLKYIQSNKVSIPLNMYTERMTSQHFNFTLILKFELRSAPNVIVH